MLTFWIKVPYKDREKQKEFQRNLYLNNKDKWAERQRIRRKEWRIWHLNIKKNCSCVSCGEDNYLVLDFHHVDDKNKNFSICDGVHNGFKKEIILEEIKKCVLLCVNCHRLTYKTKIVNEKTEWIKRYKEKKGCSKCNKKMPGVCLDFHHVNKSGKFIEISNMIDRHYSLKSIIKEVEKCIVLCANCHRIEHCRW